MPDQRKYPRYSCSIKTKFEYFTGNPDEVNMDTSVAEKGKGVIIDISRGVSLSPAVHGSRPVCRLS